MTLSHVQLGVRRMLADVEMFRAMDPAERALPHFRAQRHYLADKLRRLRQRLDGGAFAQQGDPPTTAAPGAILGKMPVIAPGPDR